MIIICLITILITTDSFVSSFCNIADEFSLSFAEVCTYSNGVFVVIIPLSPFYNIVIIL